MEAENIVAVTETVAGASKNDIWGLLVYLLVVFGIIYVFMVRPQKRRMAEYKKMLDAIKVGNRVMAAGIYGTVKKVGEKTLEIEIAKGVVVEVNKNAVAGVEE